jgi:hypothetical protein
MGFKTPARRRDWWLDLMELHPELQQWGQKNDASTGNGHVACTHVCIQALVLGWTGQMPTIDEVSKAAGFPTDKQKAKEWGMNSSQVIRALTHFSVLYQFVRWDWEQLELHSMTHGPVLFGCAYGAQPEWHGFKYLGKEATGEVNGFARPLGSAGKTQLTGFVGGHAELLLGIRNVRNEDGSLRRRDDYIKDPNHGSPVRKERPPYDIITSSQGRKLYESWAQLGGRPVYGFIPLDVHERPKT